MNNFKIYVEYDKNGKCGIWSGFVEAESLEAAKARVIEILDRFNIGLKWVTNIQGYEV